MSIIENQDSSRFQGISTNNTLDPEKTFTDNSEDIKTKRAEVEKSFMKFTLNIYQEIMNKKKEEHEKEK